MIETQNFTNNLTSLDERSFFKAAAALANFKNVKNQHLAKSKDSTFLEPGYQECSHAFLTKFEPFFTRSVYKEHFFTALIKFQKAFGIDVEILENPDQIFGKSYHRNKILNYNLFPRPIKYVYHNGQVFFPEETASLVLAFSILTSQDASLSAIKSHFEHNIAAKTFHENLLSLMTGNQKAFVLSAKYGDKPCHFNITSARLFWAHRLRRKSWQKTPGTDPMLKYFHAELKSSNNKDILDLIYWLKFDAKNNIIASQFLDLSFKGKKTLQPYKLGVAHENLLEELRQNTSLAPLQFWLFKSLLLHKNSLI